MRPRSNHPRRPAHREALADHQALTGLGWGERADDALRIGAQVWSYTGLAELIERRAASFRRQGLEPGEVVVYPTEPAPASVITERAIAHLGAAILPIGIDASEARRAQMIRSAGAEWTWQPPVDADRADGTLLRTSSDRKQVSLRERSTAVAVLTATSGSSATPKIAMLSATNVIASCTAVIDRLGLSRGDTWLCCLPRHHVSGLAIGYRCAVAGATLEIVQRFDAAEVHRRLASGAITHLSLVPPMLQRLLSHRMHPPAQLRAVLVGGQPLNPALAGRAVDAGWPLYLGYGMTETFSQIAGSWIDATGSALNRLEPLAGVELTAPECGDHDPREMNSANPVAAQSPTASGAPLHVRGPMLMLGYANPNRIPGFGLHQGWLRTGDLACQGADGRLRIIGRGDDTMIIAGFNVIPADVEQRLAEVEGVDDIAIVGIPDPVWGHRLVALYAGAKELGSLERWCRAELPSHLRPRGFVRLEGLPELPSGKRDRQTLMRLAKANADR